MALVGLIAGIDLVAADVAVRERMAALPERDRTLSASAYSPTAAGHGELDDGIESGLVPAGAYAEAPIHGVIFRRVRDAASNLDLQVVALDDVDRWVALAEGRLPARCDGQSCEGVLLSRSPAPESLPNDLSVGGLGIEVVGRGVIDSALPLGELAQTGPATSPGDPSYYLDEPPPSALLLVRGVAATVRAEGLATIGRTSMWTAPLRVERIHPWSVRELRETVEAVQQALLPVRPTPTVQTPLAALDRELARISAAGGRLLLVAAFAAAVLLAFAAYAGSIGRAEVEAEVRRLRSAGARRGQVAAFVALESAVPVVVGAVVGWIVAASGVVALTAWRDVEAVPVLAGALLDPGRLAAIGAVVVVAYAFLAAAIAPWSLGAPAGRAVAVAAVTAAILLGWQVLASGGLGRETLASAPAGPALVVLPAAVAFVTAALCLIGLPPVFRALAARATRWPVSVRLAVLSLARDPGRPAATLTLLAFSLGALVFAAGYATTLRVSADEQATYDTGLDLRVREFGSGLTSTASVVPLDRYRSLPGRPDVVPVVRTSARAGSGGPVELMGLPGAEIPSLPGWRADFSSAPAADLARQVSIAGDWSLRGRNLPAGQASLDLAIDLRGDALLLTAVVAAPNGDFARVAYGPLQPGRRMVRAALPADARGGTLVAVELANSSFIGGEYHPGELQHATVVFENIPEVVAARPLGLELAGPDRAVFIAPQPTDGVQLPAIVSPDLARLAASDGRLTLTVPGDRELALSVVGTASHFPTIRGDPPRFAVVDLDPLLVALNAAVPGSAMPSEAWLRVRDGQPVVVEQALEGAPFRSAVVASRDRLEAAIANDPLAQAVLWALALAAAVGVALAVLGVVLGAVVDLRDGSGDLADLSAQGMTVAELRRMTVARTVVLTSAGSLAGLAVGAALVAVVTATVGLSSDAARPLPPLAARLPVEPVALAVAAFACTMAGLVFALSGRALRPAARPGRSSGNGG